MDATKHISIKDIRQLTKACFDSIGKKAKEGDAISQFNLALCHMYGQHTVADLGDAFTWFEKAKLHGDKLAGQYLGHFHEVGFGRKNNFCLALQNYVESSPYARAKGKEKKSKEANKLDEQSIGKCLDELQKEAVKLASSILKIDNLCVYQPKDGSISINWTAAIRQELKAPLQKYNDLVEGFKVYLDAYTSDSDDDKYGEWTYIYEDQLRLTYEVLNALVARDEFLTGFAGKGFETSRKDFEYALGRCIIDDNDSKDNDYIISGLLLMAGHDEDPRWQNRVGLWYEYHTENRDLLLAEQWYKKAEAQGLVEAKVNLERLRAKKEYRLAKNSGEGTAEDRLEIAKKIKGNEELRAKWLIAAAKHGSPQALEFLLTGLTVEQASLLGTKARYSPLWKKYEKEKEESEKQSKEWTENQDKAFKKSLDDIKRKKEEEEERKRREQEEEERRRLRKEKWEEFKERVGDFWQRIKLWLIAIPLLALAGGAFWYFSQPKEKEGEENIENADVELKKENLDYIYSEEGFTERLDEIMKEEIESPYNGSPSARVFSREYRDLYQRINEWDDEHVDGYGFWDTDWWGGQGQPLIDYKLLKINRLTRNTAVVELRIVHGEDSNSWQDNATVNLIFEEGNWMIDDINGTKEGMESYLENDGWDHEEIDEEYSEIYSMSYVGSVGEYPIEMSLKFEGKLVTGTYRYTNSSSKARLNLMGVINDDGSLELSETNDEGMSTGHFNGTLRSGIYQGTFVNYKGESMSFYLGSLD